MYKFVRSLIAASLVFGLGITSLYAQDNSSFEGFQIEDAIIRVADITGKAVVSISTEHTAKVRGTRSFYFNSPLGQDDPFRKFFEDFFGEMPDREYKQVGLGSGVIIDAQGYILTNQHVISETDKITVTLPDAREFKGEVKGQDQRSDLAIIKINAKNLPVAALGDSDTLKIGQWVVAIGNPFGFALQNPEPTVTAGVISALRRSLGRAVSQERDYSDLIQTDAAINPGNSGGPLVNLKGEVVGINVAIFSTSGGYQGVGFAIPVNNAKRIIDRLIEGKKILYGWLGVTVQNLDEDLVNNLRLPNKNGALINKVWEDTPASKTGLKEGDVIVEFDNREVKDARGLSKIVGNTEVGKKVNVAVVRETKKLTLGVQIEEMSEGAQDESSGVSSKTWRGLKVEELTSDNLRRLRIDVKKGVVVTGVEPNSPADEAGISPGDVILAINRQVVSNIQDYNNITKKIQGDALVKTAQRGFIVIKGK